MEKQVRVNVKDAEILISEVFQKKDLRLKSLILIKDIR